MLLGMLRLCYCGLRYVDRKLNKVEKHIKYFVIFVSLFRIL